MTRADTWAFIGPDIDELRDVLESRFGLRFEEHDSEYWGGLYWGTPVPDSPRVKVFANNEDEDGVLYVHGHSEVTAIVDAAGLSDQQAEAIQALGGIPIEEYGNLST